MFDSSKNDLTPYGNTGAMDTRENALRGLIDWVSVTFFSVKNWQDVTRIIGLNSDDFRVENKGYQGYQNRAEFNGIMIAFDPSANTKSMGIHLNMSGQACRHYENYFKNNHKIWSEMFLLINQHDHKFSRLDIAVDDFKPYFKIDQAYSCAKRGCMTAKRIKKARSYEEFFIDDGRTDSRTLYVGKTDWMIRFYNKYVERKNKGFEFDDNITDWNRYEIQLRGKVATEAGKMIAFEAIELGQFVKGFLADKIDFKVKNENDTNKSRWKSTRWWSTFLGDVEKIPLTQIAPDPTIPKIHNWLDTQVNTSFITYLEAFDYSPIVYEFFKLRGMEKIDNSKQKIIDEFNENVDLKNRMLKDMASYIEQKKEDNQFG